MLLCGRAPRVRRSNGLDAQCEARVAALYQRLVEKEEQRVLKEIEADLEDATGKRDDGLRALVQAETDLANQWQREQQRVQEDLAAVTQLRSALESQQQRQRKLLAALDGLQLRRLELGRQQQQAELEAVTSAVKAQAAAQAEYETEMKQQVETLRAAVEEQFKTVTAAVETFQQLGHKTLEYDSIEDTNKAALRDAAVLEAVQLLIQQQTVRQKRLPSVVKTEEHRPVVHTLDRTATSFERTTPQLPERLSTAAPQTMELLGRDFDLWYFQTRHNLRACCARFCEDPDSENSPLHSYQYYDEVREGPLGQLCCCNTGHSKQCRVRCPVCRLLDLSDTVLLP